MKRVRGYTDYQGSMLTPEPTTLTAYPVYEGDDEAIIVSRHAGLVMWLAERGIVGEVITHITDPAQVAGRVVYGALPFHLAALAAEVVVIDMPGLTREQRGKDLTPEEMDAAGASMQSYIVMRAQS